MTRITRRNVLKAAGLGGAALGATAFAPVTAPVRRPPQTAKLGDPVEGPLAHVYKRYGIPRGVVLGHTGDASTGRAITWQTTGSIDPGTEVRYTKVAPGTDPRDVSMGDLRASTTGSSQFAPSGMYEDDSNETTGIEGEHPSLIHRAALTLEAGATYAYAVGGSGLFSPIRTFTPTPAPGDTWTFTHLGDHGTRTASRRVAAELASRDHDLHLIAGDISYADGYQPTWDDWANIAEVTHGSIPLITTPGNHESKDYFGQTYRKRFARPNSGGFMGTSVGNENAFGFTQGNVFFVSGSGGAFLADRQSFQGATDLVNELVQIELLFADAAVRRAAGELDFLVYSQHFPLFTNEDGRGPISPEYVLTLEQILQRYQVDLVLVGHDHMYQRSTPVAYGVPTGTAPEDGGPGYTQVIAGSGGKSLYEFAMTDWTEVPGEVLSGDVDEDTIQFRGPWTLTDHLQFCFTEYTVSPGRMDVAGMIFEDFGDGIDEDPYAIPDTHTRSGDSPEITATTELDEHGVARAWREPVVGDSFTVSRKADVLVQQAARAGVRTPDEIVGNLPEARGEFVWRERDDCTLHEH